MDNVMEFPDINQIKDEAAVWVAKIHGLTYKTGQSLPQEQADALRMWLAQSDLHRDAFVTMLSGWDAMAMLEELADVLPISDVSVYQEERQAPQRVAWFKRLGDLASKKRRYAFSGAATFACAALFALVMFVVPQQNRYTTDIGEQASYTLDDGSVLTLNTNSEIEVDYTDNKRTIILHRGEAGFDVAKNKARPFVVYAGEGMVWAVGTAFNVSYRKDYVDVVVSEGTVKVFSGITQSDKTPALSTLDLTAQPFPESPTKDTIAHSVRDILLSAGESAQYNEAIVVKEALEAQSLEKKLAWQQGSLFFQGETLQEAIVEIARYTDRRLVIVDSSIRNTRVGGRFKTNDVDALLHSLSKSLNIKMEEGEGSQLLFSAK